jgi:hypothetical protein
MDGGEADRVDRVDAVLGEVAGQAGGTVRREPGVRREVRRVVLRDLIDELGSWVYVVPPGRVPSLVGALGGGGGDDVLDLLARYYQRTGGRIGDLLRSPEVAAEFSNWHS